ncbi:uncharacterized protein PV06_03214 [Exophiala oligosperma]|uniref:3-oxoacyl-[acyl-carrier-protein] reductase n=2 Tax=Chaetothyriales TaxID=34395 RepID=A0A0D2AY63_9EURO|nr:uncharacterized protein PV06_03214 [Exophiala oligosperma]KAJ9642227.1 hypothetical protein H2204_002596 [Knufia peltigerae]KIW44766.1 hypothetical protein PV06_03214 [Exophiala oligosperma]
MLSGKVVLITGCSSGIGLATTKACLDAKAQVFGCDVQKPPAELLGLPNFSFQSCDVSKQADISATVEACAKAFNGRIDVLLNVAGISDSLGSVDSLDDEQYDRVVAVDLTGPIKLMRGVIPYMRAQKSGSIVNVSSRAGMGGGVAGVTYTASKHGLIGATKNVAWRYHQEGIRCNAICPGGVRTNITNAISEGIDVEAFQNSRPVLNVHFNPRSTDALNGQDGPIATGPISPEEVANVLVFLASDLSSAINGAVVPVDKAWSAV